MKRGSIYRAARTTVGGAFLLVVACESPSAFVDEDGPDPVTLTADQPVAAFEVKLCVSEDPPAEFEGDGTFRGQARVSEGEVELTLENLEVDPNYAVPEGSDPPIQVETLSGGVVDFGVILTLDVNGLVAGDCTEAQVVQFSASGLTDGQTVTITSSEAVFGGEWTESLCPSNFSESAMSLEIEAL